MKKISLCFILFLTVHIPVAGINEIFAYSNDSLLKPILSNSSTLQVYSDEMVMTPVGLMLKSKVHKVDSGFYLNITEKSIQIIQTRTGRISKEFAGTATNFNRKNANFKKATYESGYIIEAYWGNRSIRPITSYNASIVVPTPPVIDNGQTIFVFSALTNATDILQPVLQWGGSAAGGGSYWAISNWYVTDWGNEIFYTPLIKVNPGTKLQGTMKLTSQSINSFSYSSSFSGYLLDTELQVKNARKLYDATIALEAYWITKCSDYPLGRVKVNEIKIETDSITPFLNWSIQNYQTTRCGQYLTIMSNKSFGDEIDIYFCKPCSSEPFSGTLSSDEEFKFYPNPTTGKLQISYPHLLGNFMIEIFDAYGNLMQLPLKETIADGYFLDFQSFSPGLYIIRVSNNQKSYLYKVIKK